MKRLVIIDGMSVFYRGFFAMPGLSLSDGTPTGGVFGFASIAVEVIKKLEPDYVAVAWDIPKTSTTQRSKIYPEYKAGRTKPPDDFYTQLPILHELLDAFGWPLYELDGYEADDIMGTFAAAADKRSDIETCLVTGDYDMMQLISPGTNIYITKKGSELIQFGDDQFLEKYGVHVKQFIDYKALVGDSSDNIPGVRGIGPKAAISLLEKYGTLDGIYEHLDEQKGALLTKLTIDRDNAFMSRELARIFTNAPIELDYHEADVNNTNLENVAAILKRLEFNSLVKRLPKHMQQMPEQGALYFDQPAIVEINEKPWPDTLTLDSTVTIALSEDTLWLSPDVSTVYQKKLSDIDASVWKVLELAEVVAYDVKQLYHDLAAKHIFVQFSAVHDVRQAAFLIDPLRRDRSLSALVGEEIMSPQAEVAGLWQVFGWQKEAFTHTPKVAEVAHKLDFPLIYPLFLMEHEGIKVDKKQLAIMSKELETEYAAGEQEMYTMVGNEFNIGSPAQLSEVLFTKLQLPTAGIKKGKTGFSTDQKTLDKLRGQHPIIELIERTRELAKLKNTYVDTLPELADKNHRIHTTFAQDVAATGRLSSNNPNLQNIPVRSDLGRRIRTAFVPRVGNVFISADYSQFELRLAAILAGDEELINDFNSDVDIHTKTASDVYGIPLEEVTKNQRRDAKVINFGVLYGMSPHGLAAATGMNFTEAKQFIDQYFTMRAPIRKYIDATLNQARTEGYVETYYGRRRPTPDIHSSNFIVRQGAERAAANMPIQGTEADLMKMAMLKVETALSGAGVRSGVQSVEIDDALPAESRASRSTSAPLGKQLLQIHDSILVEAPKENADTIAEILKETMESIAPELRIKLKVDVSIGTNWGEL